jgi:hypothetical protein
MDDPKRIWQSQPTEPLRMSSDEIRRKAQELQRRGRLATLAQIGIGVFLSVSFGRMFLKVHEVIPRAGWLVLSLWSLYVAYQAYRWVWPGRLDANATSRTSLAYYRHELERLRDYEWNVWRRTGLTWCFLGLALALIPVLAKASESPRMLLNAAPFFVLLLVWFALFFPMRRRKRQKIQRDIDELNRMDTA